jgi:hypothetical protein
MGNFNDANFDGKIYGRTEIRMDAKHD